jgi:hypothetical protein
MDKNASFIGHSDGQFSTAPLSVRLAKQCHFGRAAESFGVTQSTLRGGIKELEARLGVTPLALLWQIFSGWGVFGIPEREFA